MLKDIIYFPDGYKQNEATCSFDAHYLWLCDLEFFLKETIFCLCRISHNPGLDCGPFYSDTRVLSSSRLKTWFYSTSFFHFFTSLIINWFISDVRNVLHCEFVLSIPIGNKSQRTDFCLWLRNNNNIPHLRIITSYQHPIRKKHTENVRII